MSPDQFFCKNFWVSEGYDFSCFNATIFSNFPFDTLCPSGDCAKDCLDLPALYQEQPRTISEGDVTRYDLCSGLGHAADALKLGFASPAEASRIEPFFRNVNTSSLLQTADAVNRCLVNTCDQSRDFKSCTSALVINSTIPSLAGRAICLEFLCDSDLGLPVANQDIVGIGVSSSYLNRSSC